MNKCIGCGSVVDNNDLCERCFRIRNYSEYKLVDVDNSKFIDILKGINLTNDLVVLVVDVFNFNNLDMIKKYLHNDILVVLTKRDLLPKRVNDEKLKSYFNCRNIVVISSNKNYNFDLLYELIIKYKKSRNVYVVGFTNAGKSTMINKIIYNYSDFDTVITTSPMPSTTLDSISIDINDDLRLIDTPGILNDRCLYNNIYGKELKRILPKREIKPISYQIKGRQYIVIDKYALVEACDINIVIFVSNSLNIKRYYKEIPRLEYVHRLNVSSNDIVIDGLGFIKVIGKGNVIISTSSDVDVFVRDSLI